MKQKAICLAIIIFTILFVFVSSSYAVLKGKTNMSGNIQLASWNVYLNQTGVNNNLTIVPNSLTANYTLNITSIADVDIKYSVIVKSLPEGVEIAFDGGEFQTQVNNTITFTDVGLILYTDTEKSKSHTLTFRADINAEAVLEQGVDIDVSVKQIV